MTIKPDALSVLLEEDRISMPAPNASGQIMINCFNPQHDDKTPSLAINKAKGMYYCHGCGIKGNAYTYLVDIRRYNKKKVMQKLEQLGLTDERKDFQKEKWEDKERRKKGLPPKSTWLHRWPLNSKGEPMRKYKYVADYTYLDEEGNIIFIKRRWEDASDVDNIRKMFWIYTKASDDDGWWLSSPLNEGLLEKDRIAQYPLYNFQSVTQNQIDDQVWFVEGEKCVDTVNSVLGKIFASGPPPCVSCCGGNTIRFSQHDFSPLKNRKVLLLSDQDDGGRRFMERLADHLHTYWNCRVRLCLPKGENKIDIHDMLMDSGWKKTKEWLKDNITEHQKPPDLSNTSNPTQERDLLFGEKYFKILGISDDFIVFQNKITAQIVYLKGSLLTQESQLITLAPLDFWVGLCTNPKALDKTNRLNIADAIIRYAQSKGVFSLTKSSYGRGGAKVDGKYYYNLGKNVLVQELDRVLRIDKNVVDVDAEGALFLPGNEIKMKDDEYAGAEAGKRLYSAIMAYRWDKFEHGKAFAGFIVTAIMGGCLDYRPMLWMLAPATSGKSWLLDNVLKKALGEILVDAGNTTEAGLSHLMGCDSLAVYIDEFEPTSGKWDGSRYDDLLLLIRLASTGQSSRIRAGGKDVRPRFSTILTSINRPDLSEANQSRYFVVKLSKDGVPDWHELENAIIQATEKTKMLMMRSWVIRNAGIIADDALIIEKEMSKTYPIMNHRERKIISALTAGARFISGNKSLMITKDKDDLIEIDELKLLHDIMNSMIQVKTDDGNEYFSVSECLNTVFNNYSLINSNTLSDATNFDKTLQRYGLRAIVKEGDYSLHIHFHSDSMKRLLKDSKLSNIAINEYLSGLDGVDKSTQHIIMAGRQVRTKRLNYKILMDLGLDIKPKRPPEMKPDDEFY